MALSILIAPILIGLVMGFGITVVLLLALKSESEELSRLPRWIERRIGQRPFLISRASIFVGVLVWCSLLALSLLLPWNGSANDTLLVVLSGVFGCFSGMFCWRATKRLG